MIYNLLLKLIKLLFFTYLSIIITSLIMVFFIETLIFVMELFIENFKYPYSISIMKYMDNSFYIFYYFIYSFIFTSSNKLNNNYLVLSLIVLVAIPNMLYHEYLFNYKEHKIDFEAFFVRSPLLYTILSALGIIMDFTIFIYIFKYFVIKFQLKSEQ